MNKNINERIQTLFELYQNKKDETEDYAKSIIDEFPNHPASYKILSFILLNSARFSESLPILKKLLKITPKDPEIYYLLGIGLQGLNQYEEAINNYKKVIKLKPDFILAYSNLANNFQLLGKFEEAIEAYRKVLTLKPDFAEAYNNMGNALRENGNLEESIKCFKKAITIKPDYLLAKNNLDLALKIYVPQWHITMLNDKSRNNAYLEAIKLAVKKESLVLEIGTGSGLLAMLAAANGADKVITCEENKIISKTAKKIISKNGYEKKINVINKKSTHLMIGEDIPKKADLLISEILSSQFVGEGILESIFDARNRLLKDKGKMIPESGAIRIALIGENKEILDSVSIKKFNEFDLSEFSEITPRRIDLNLKEKVNFLSDFYNAFNVDFKKISNDIKDEKIIKLKSNKDGLCLGLIQWLQVKLYQDVEYENIPFEQPSHWSTPIYLLNKPIKLNKGDFIEIRALLDKDSLWFSFK